MLGVIHLAPRSAKLSFYLREFPPSLREFSPYALDLLFVLGHTLSGALLVPGSVPALLRSVLCLTTRNAARQVLQERLHANRYTKTFVESGNRQVISFSLGES